MPPAPERLSTTTDLPRIFSSAAATGRAARSACPPGGKATIMVMLRDGCQAWACADEPSAPIIGAASAPVRNLRRSMDFLPCTLSSFGGDAVRGRARLRHRIAQDADALDLAFDDIARQAVAR